MPLIQPWREFDEECLKADEAIDHLIEGRPLDPYEAFLDEAREPVESENNDPVALAEEVPRW
jgi:hypothetical protein